MGSHARLSPSGAHRWGACAGSVREESRFPEPESGKAAIDGTHSHTLLEWCIKNKLADPLTRVGETMKDDDGEFVVDQDRARRVLTHVAYVRDRIKDDPTAEVLSEEQVNPSWLLRRDDIFGTADTQLYLWKEKTLEVIDYKDGMHPVEAKDNPQLIIYGLGALSKFKLTMFEPYPFDRVRLTIVQPKLAYKGMAAVRSHDYTVMELLMKVPDIMIKAAATDDPNAPLVPGDEQCKYCAAKGSCSALAGHVMKVAGVTFPDLTETNEVKMIPSDIAQQFAAKDPSTMDDAEIRRILEAAPLMRTFVEGVEAEAKKRLESGRPVPGFKLVRGRGSRAWALPEEEVAEKLKKMGVPKDAIFKSEVISPAQAEKVTWTKKDQPVQLSEKQVKMMQEWIKSTPGKLTLVPESDDRPAVTTDASAMFSAVPAAAPAAPLHKPECILHTHPAASCTCASVAPAPIDTPAPAAPVIELPDWLRPR